MIFKDKVRFGIVGCGRISYRHIESIQENPNAELVAVCDLNLERAMKRNEGIGVKVYRNYNEMLKIENIDVVCLMTPSGMHAEHCLDIMGKFKKHLVVEKPICLSLADGRKMIDTADELGVKIFAVHQNRFNKAIQKIRSAIDGQAFGKIVLATVRIRWSRGQGYYDRDPWRGTWGLDGGALTNQSIHHLDLLQWLVGEIDSLSAIGTTQLVNVEIEDTACAWIKFKSGAFGSVEATTATRPLNTDLEASISILGENGSVIVEGASVNKLMTWTFDDIDLTEYSENPPNVYGFGHNYIINNVIDALSKGEHPLVSGRDALDSIKFLHALYRSIELGGKEVFMDDNPISERLGVLDSSTQSIADLYRTDKVLGALS